MKRLMLVLGLLSGFPLALAAEVSKEELKMLASAGISDNVILSYVKTHGPVAKLSPEDIIELKNAGLKESLLAQLLTLPAAVPPVAGPSTTTYVQTPAPYYDSPSVVYGDVYPSYDYGTWGWGYPYCGLGLGFYGGRYCGGYYNGYSCWNRYPYWGGYCGNRFYGNGFHSGAIVRGNSGFSGSHGTFGGSVHGGFSGGHGGSSGGGHGGHR